MTDPADRARLMRGVIPYLTIDGADAAVEFYKKAFGAIQHGETVRGETGKVLNAGLEINGGMVMLVDFLPEMPEGPAKAAQGFMMQIVTPDGQAFWDRAIEAGCTVVTPFATQFWGDTWGQFNDPFGIGWAINQPSQASQAAFQAQGQTQ